MTDTTTTDSDDAETYELTADELAGIQMRTMLAANLGKQYDGDRDLYEAFGWDEQPGVEDFYAMYLRHPYARAVVDIPATTTWRDPPTITDSVEMGAGETTAFEDDLATLEDDERLWHYARRADKLAGIGEYGVLVIGFADNRDLAAPVDGGEIDGPADVRWLRPFSQLSVEDLRLDDDPQSDRWGYPEYYRLDLGDEDDATPETSTTAWVHHSRVIHIAENLLDDDIRGTPRMEPVYNALFDIEKTLGAAAEMAYRGADYGLAVNVDSGYQLEDGGDRMEQELQEFMHGFSKTMQLEGADVEQIGGNDIDPTPIINPEIEAISAYTGMPQSMLKGNETGERATTEDRKEWYGSIAERREQTTTPIIVRDLIDRLTEYGAVSQPNGGGYDVAWPPLAEQSESDEADVQATRAEVLQQVQALLAGMTTADVVEFIETGEFPDLGAESTADVPPIDEADENVQDYYGSAFPEAEADD
ncbi:hypothetical protein J2752_000444 [Halarchaeum rubridurum]|uniref:Anti-CBASS protein Acb1-like N-terminal domain-containing protein n=1 Tax=Halarchaeum rubridurum TaxID=489911 RepID=A0A830FYU9_9EURY|nr:anti-CBASS Acb1 family protein [Halarchaeum rubridurum]MBP1953563.1 hypothetical protein [Halarchaeum rubridurum]GGM64360.1 hypothetical protein GCM10009017_12980 [Halarchaeum rubridurum]